MIDPRFYEVLGPLKASEIAELAGASAIRGDSSRAVASVASASAAGPSDLTFLEDADRNAGSLAAGVCIVSPSAAKLVPASLTVIESDRPRAAFGKAVRRLVRLREIEPGAAIHPEARIDASAVIEPGVVIGRAAAIGAGTRIGANAVIGPGVQIGARSVIGAGAVVRCALLGDDVRILSGAVVGEGGFGLTSVGGGRAVLTPHLGRVIMQDGVSLGANSTIDRGFLEDTVIGEGSHIDNLCHVGHNCRIGRNFVAAAFAGISGSCEIGDDVQFGGRVGIRDHIRIGTGARLAAGAAVTCDIPAGETWAGYPARPHRRWLRELAWLSRASQKRSAKEE